MAAVFIKKVKADLPDKNYFPGILIMCGIGCPGLDIFMIN